MGAVAIFAVMVGCASGPRSNPTDPLEPFNRSMTEFNEAIDRAVLKPVATGYKNVTPAPVRTGVANFFANLGDLWSSFNNLLQLKVAAAAETFLRFNVNTFFGLAGILDIAGEAGIERHREDFGQTLAYWGVPAGPYLVLPLFGPSTLRDTIVLPVETHGNLLSLVEPTGTRYSLYGLRAVEIRANLLRAGNVLDEASIDKYSFTRDAFLQRRRSEVWDGEPPDSDAKKVPAADQARRIREQAREIIQNGKSEPDAAPKAPAPAEGDGKNPDTQGGKNTDTADGAEAE